MILDLRGGECQVIPPDPISLYHAGTRLPSNIKEYFLLFGRRLGRLRIPPQAVFAQQQQDGGGDEDR